MTTTTYEPVTVADPRLDDKKFILEGIDVSKGPTFTVTEMAKVFFGRSSHWVRLHESEGKLVLDGSPVGARRTQAGARVYNLADVEQISHALAQQGEISGRQLNDALLIVSTMARVWNYI